MEQPQDRARRLHIGGRERDNSEFAMRGAPISLNMVAERSSV